MSIDGIRLMLDFGLLTLIWIVQLIIYPSFLYYDTHNLIKWHKKYVANFGFIVMPLMLGQLGIAIYQVIILNTASTIVNLAIVMLIWASTFFQFVPIHNGISKGIVTETMLKTLVTKNWIRTFLWTLVFIMGCVYYLST